MRKKNRSSVEEYDGRIGEQKAFVEQLRRWQGIEGIAEVVDCSGCSAPAWLSPAFLFLVPHSGAGRFDFCGSAGDCSMQQYGARKDWMIGS